MKKAQGYDSKKTGQVKLITRIDKPLKERLLKEVASLRKEFPEAKVSMNSFVTIAIQQHLDNLAK
jgi:predicted HicB family RNase H-like nuclease